MFASPTSYMLTDILRFALLDWGVFYRFLCGLELQPVGYFSNLTGSSITSCRVLPDHRLGAANSLAGKKERRSPFLSLQLTFEVVAPRLALPLSVSVSASLAVSSAEATPILSSLCRLLADPPLFTLLLFEHSPWRPCLLEASYTLNQKVLLFNLFVCAVTTR